MMKKRLLSLLLALAMVLTLLPAPALAAEETTQTAAPVAETVAETVQETVQAAADAPSGMEHLLTDGKLEGSLKRQPLYAAKDNGYYTDVVDAIAQLRSKMVSRTRAISIPLRVSKADVPGEEEMDDYLYSSGNVQKKPVLVSFNPKYDPIRVTQHNNFAVVGKVLNRTGFDYKG